MSPLLLVLLAVVSTARAQHAPDDVIDPAVAFDLTPDGLEQVLSFGAVTIPGGLPLPDVDVSVGECPFNYGYSIAGAEVSFALAGISAVPHSGEEAGDRGYLDVGIELLVSMNDESLPFDFGYELVCTEDQCGGWVDPFPVTVRGVRVYLDVTDDGTIDATVATDDDRVLIELEDEDAHLDGCSYDTVQAVLDLSGISVADLLVDLARPQIGATVDALAPLIETAIESDLGGFDIEETIDVGDRAYDISLHPSDVLIEHAGVRFLMQGQMTTDAVDICVVDWDPKSSLETGRAPPPLGSTPAGVGAWDMAVDVSDDFTDQALYAVWRGGFFCSALDAETFPLDTALLGLLAQDSFARLFPEAAPVTIELHPRTPPVIVPDAAHDFGIALDDLGVGFYAELDARMALLFEVNADVVLGVDAVFDPETGMLQLQMDVGGEEVAATVAEDELMPEADSAIAAGFETLFGIFGSGLAGATDFAFPTPSVDGMGATGITAADSSGWLGFYTTIGKVSYVSKKGCGCGASPSTGLAWLVPLAFVVLRRRSA